MTRTNAANRPARGDGIIGLLCAVLEGMPKMSGALCRGRAELFDAAHANADDISRAIDLCRACDCIAACATYAGNRRRPLVGVVAGVYRAPTRYDRDEDDRRVTNGDRDND